MKRSIAIFSVILAITAIFITRPATAGTPVSGNIRQTLAEAVTFPDNATTMEATETAEILFSVTDDGKITIKSIKCSNDELKEHITNTVSKLKLSFPADPDETFYRISFTFVKP